ncbi:pyridoxamine 5'-phosphate oxidase [Pseudopedobacter sp.]|uniref:pyridoxamine 5'-phosphate oxidase n=1 Tax=Pseudopedobacter sp. TaxID=1936787 RepID=UPI00333FB6DB
MNEQKLNIRDLRQDYKSSSLSESDVAKNPIDQFALWFNHAIETHILEPNAMTIATVNEEGFPGTRVVLLKEFDQEGFTFFTNYNSQKGRDMERNPKVSLLFFWVELERQVRIEGIAKKISAEASEDYFHSRPHGSQLGAHASPQSTVIPNRDFLEDNLKSLEDKFKDSEVPKPEYWGGYKIYPKSIEFWQGRSNRLHDRIKYTLTGDNNWKIERLAP